MHAAWLLDIRVKALFELASSQQARAVREKPETP
jgi:hypothetical protein